MEIIIVRHGKPNLSQTEWIRPLQMQAWIASYNQAEVLLESIPADTLAKAKLSKIIVSSTLLRSVQSAQMLNEGKPQLSEAVFCEAELPYNNWHMLKLPVAIWAAIFRLAWFCGYSAHAESLSQAKHRANVAAKRLIALAQENEIVFFVGHGIFNRLIHKELLALGWLTKEKPAAAYWQFARYFSP